MAITADSRLKACKLFSSGAQMLCREKQIALGMGGEVMGGEGTKMSKVMLGKKVLHKTCKEWPKLYKKIDDNNLVNDQRNTIESYVKKKSISNKKLKLS